MDHCEGSKFWLSKVEQPKTAGRSKNLWNYYTKASLKIQKCRSVWVSFCGPFLSNWSCSLQILTHDILSKWMNTYGRTWHNITLGLESVHSYGCKFTTVRVWRLLRPSVCLLSRLPSQRPSTTCENEWYIHSRLYSRFSDHQFSVLPRFSSQNSDYQIAIYLVTDTQFSGFSQFSG